jgi:hypothetical protein
VVAVNYAANQSQCYLRLPFPDLGGRTWRLQDRLGDARYDRSGDDLASAGLYLDMPPWQAHVFSIEAIDEGTTPRTNAEEEAAMVNAR